MKLLFSIVDTEARHDFSLFLNLDS
uniref:Uncharacterized protein n=1 Tax=Arundo donax TaxID=35708 RepID=A0A0A9QAX0_ARUDO